MKTLGHVLVCLAVTLVVCRPADAQTDSSLRQTALSLEQQGKIAEASEMWRAIVKAHPANAEAYAHLGLIEARQEHYKEAVPYYRKALALNPSVPGLRVNLGLAFFKAGETQDAVREFTAALKDLPANSPDRLRVVILAGMSHYALGEYADAATFLREAAAQDKQNLSLRLTLAQACLWSKQSQCVLDVYREMLELNADSAEVDMLAGEALDDLKDNAGATGMFRAAVKADPKLPDVHFGLGYLLWTQKQYPEASEEFMRELDNNPDHIQAALYLADAYIQMNRMNEARPLLVKVVKQNPELGLGHLDLGIVLSEAGQNEEALQELTAAARLIPQEVNVHWRLGRVYRALGRKDEAKAEFEKASTLNKAADEDLYNKISQGRARPAPESQTAPQGK